jgi:hypothetical protein
LSAIAPNDQAAHFDGDHAGFSASLKFAITNSVTGGPNWIVTRFIGPGAELLASSRTDTHQLLISFARKGASGEATSSAVGQAQSKNLFMLLQSLPTQPFNRFR